MSNGTEYMSLREIGRRLNIPPSSVAYYKDRFSRFIPQQGGSGRRTRYPADALPIFKEIRHMFNNNYSAEQVERDLARKFSPMHDTGAAPNEARSLSELASVVEKLSDLLDTQALFRAEIESLRTELSTLRQEKELIEKRYRDEIGRLETEVAELRRERTDMFEKIWERIDRKDRGGTGHAKSPDSDFMHLPLVVMNDKGEYLGVAGKHGHFSLQEFIRIVRRNARESDRRVTLRWDAAGSDGYVLTLTTRGTDGQGHEHAIELQQTVTPNGNRVVRIARLTIDGNPVPDPFLLVLFRKIRDGFDI
ncbi:MerR family transcriptional regulator [Oceanidesulfovibrio indonesiensis]|uniref:MerR family transcriptional regulator n=1 Tax=Oceanidesulfovibrio indonesiensis TaxID=54767 RepID=A0A7M3MDU7_9BACT|nr:MerR family transcriptional regulator [Oceanidesulfovibrio indonesiensis]TVM16897.1 MerR family transcriptional regulator [Oceanidesulfovibrio indonesiensis]